MWGYVFIGVLIMIFTKAGIDQAKKITVPEHTSENYSELTSPQNLHKKSAYAQQELRPTRFIPILDLPKPNKRSEQNFTDTPANYQKTISESLPLTKPVTEKLPDKHLKTDQQITRGHTATSHNQKPYGVYKIANPKTANAKARQMASNLPKELHFVALCESGMKHYNPKTGTVLKGIKNPDDIGFFQINHRYNKDEAEILGHNIYTITGNLIHAKYMHERYGLEPWKASKDCWAPKIAKWKSQKYHSMPSQTKSR